MKNPFFYISCPYDTYSGYGARARDIIKSILKTGKYDVKLLPQRWGDTPWGFCDDHEDWKYLHDLISLRNDVPVDERINGHSHIRHLFFNSSETIPVDNGELILGDWKQLFAVELDPIRKRELIVTFISE